MGKKYKKTEAYNLQASKLLKAIDGTRTRDFHLGKVALYQLSHYRISASA